MKHPDHGIKAIIVTENKVICPESNVKIKGGVMSCKIPGSPGARWYIGCLIDRLMPTMATQSVYYIYETYLEGFLIDGPLVIDRRLMASRARLSPSRDGDTEVFFFLPARINGQDEECYVRPKSWLIELKVYESDECFDDPRIPLSSAQAIIWRRDGDLPRLEKFRDSESERLIIHYKWKYRCVELLPSSLGQKSPPERQEKKTAGPTVRQADMGKDSKEVSRDISKPPIPLDCKSDSSGEILEPLPEYSWGPQPKSPPAWEQRGRGFIKLNVNPKNDIRIRSPLGKRVSDVEGLAIQSRKPVALQKVPSPNHCGGPMLPIRQLEMPSLPSGWELRYTNTYKVYYVNHNDKYTTWWHPDTLEGDETHKLDRDGEVCEEENEDERERVHDTCAKLQQLNERKELLRTKRACAEANVQRLLLGHIGPSEWREANIEHWFPENEASESIIEHTHTYFSNPKILKRALRIRDTVIAEAASLEQELDELQYLTSLPTLESMGLGLSDTPKIECNEVGVIEDRKKRGHPEELGEEQEEDKLAQEPSDQHRMYISSHASNNTGRVDYREDYGPEVPVTRDGGIDRDWHRNKIARIEGPYDGKYRTESRKLWKEYDENSLSERVYPVPRVNDSLDDDVGDDYGRQIKQAIDRSLQQYDIELRKVVESSTANSIKSSSPNLSEYCWEDYDHSLLGKAFHQQSALKSNDLEGCEMETNRESDNSMPRWISGLSISDDLRSFDLDNDHPMKTKQVSQLPEDYGTGYEKETYFDRPLLRQVSSSPKIIGDQESSDDSDLYAPPSWRRPTKTDVSPSLVLVFREVQSRILQSGTAVSGQVSSENRKNQDKHGTAISDIQHIGLASETRAKTSGVDQASLLSARRNFTSALEGETSFSNDELANKSNTVTFTMPHHDTPTADPVIGPFDNKPAGEAGATASVSK